MKPLSWWVQVEAVVCVTCRCGEVIRVSAEDVSAEGTIGGAVRCPACGWSARVTLGGWAELEQNPFTGS